MVGDIIVVHGVKLLVLDERDGNPFVLAFDLDDTSKFDNNSTDYKESILRREVETWFDDTNIKSIDREVDLTTMDGYTGYGKIMANVAPLTFDEYRKYASVIREHIKGWFWTVTGWGDPTKDNWSASSVCFVHTYGTADYYYYDYIYGRLVPAFILDKSEIINNSKSDLSNFLLRNCSRKLLSELNNSFAKN